jgi:glucosyl-3-phosphoglycerate synthase
MAISVVLPAWNEAATVGAIIEIVRKVGIVDEVVVIDDGSTDDTAAVARAAGATVVAEASILPDAGTGTGKGNVLWKSLAACTGDIICFVDADLRNFRGEYVERLCAPLLADPDTMMVKAFYARSFEGAPTGGGRVTELVARPLLSLLFPKLADIVQPLGGEYAARRAALEQVSFVEGWGVEMGLLIDIAERFGRDAIAQVDLGTREHRNRPIEELGKPALAILAIALRRAGKLERDAPFIELLRATGNDAVDITPVEVRERPPIVTLPGYRARLDPPR